MSVPVEVLMWQWKCQSWLNDESNNAKRDYEKNLDNEIIDIPLHNSKFYRFES